jgi:hypothetical protein
MCIKGCVRFIHPSLPGENSWCASQQTAQIAVQQRLARLPSGYRILHHTNPQIGTPHYHVVDPQGNPFYAHFFYSRQAPGAADKALIQRWQQELGRQGFVASAQFVRGWRQGLKAKGLHMQPARFRQIFGEAHHLRQTTPDHSARIAVWRGIVILYERGKRANPRIRLLDVLPKGAIAVAAPVQQSKGRIRN